MLYIQDMNFDAASHLLPKIRTPKLFQQYGKAKESRHQFKEALDAYTRAKDFDSMVSKFGNKCKSNISECVSYFELGSKEVPKHNMIDNNFQVRLLLNNLERPAEAFQLVRETRLQYGAEMISQYCRRRGDIRGAIE